MIITATVLFVLADMFIGIVLAFLPWSRIKDWFTSRESMFDADENKLRVTLHEKLSSGQHRVVYGIFNKATSKFIEGEAVVAKEIDGEIAEFHNGNALVVYS